MSRRSGDDVLSEWYGRDAPEVDFGMSWRTTAQPKEPWRLSWNGGSGELFAARLDRSEVQVLGTYPDVESVSSALSEWGRRALEVGGLEWLCAEMRSADRTALVRDGATVVGENERTWLRERMSDSPVVGRPELGVGIEHP